MNKYFKIVTLFFTLAAVIFSCNKEEMRYIDPMIDGMCTNIEEVIFDFNESGSWEGALVGFRAQRIKLLGIKTLIETNGYSGDNYSLEEPEQSAQRVTESLSMVEFKMDSVWSENIQGEYSAINKNSAGIVNFGASTYNETGMKITEMFNWLMEESEEVSEVEFIPNDFADLKSGISVLTGLAALNDNEVIEYINNLKAKFAEMKQQYAALAEEVTSSPYFSKAQKELYASLEAPLAAMETTINGQITLSTQDELDLIDRDLHALVYFVDNNYTSPAQAPKVFGEISSITELRWLSEVATEQDCSSDWKLTADIDAAETIRWNPDAIGPGFQQIQKFNGTFDGDYHIISGLYLTKFGAPTENRAGMFHNITGTIQNFGLVNVYVRSTANIGGQDGSLFGMMTNGAVINCFAHGIRQINSQGAGFLGRTAGTVSVENCFSAVDCTTDGAQGPGGAGNSASFIGLPTGTISIKNCYTTGKNPTRVIFGFPNSLKLNEASGIYYDSQSVGTTALDRGPAGYNASTPMMITDDGVVTDLPTSDWGNLSNFSGWSPDVWEIKTVPEIDENPRPYLKGFNYDGIKEMILNEIN